MMGAGDTYHSSSIFFLLHLHVTLNLEWCDKMIESSSQIYCCHERMAVSKAYNY